MAEPGKYTAVEGSDPASAPAAGSRILYPKSDGWYDRDDTTISRIGAVNNYAATAAPAVTDDSADGYSVGSVWIDVTNDQFYICLDSTAGAAVWHNVTSTLRASDGSPIALTADAAGALTAAVGPFTLTGGQLAFPAAQNASADVNTLDDYEEGTWTADYTCGTSGTITMDPHDLTGSYTKVGRKVTIDGFLHVDSVSSPVGALYLNGLPFLTDTGNQYRSAVTLMTGSLVATAATVMLGQIMGNASRILIYRFANGAIAACAADIQAGSYFTISATYFTP